MPPATTEEEQAGSVLVENVDDVMVEVALEDVVDVEEVDVVVTALELVV